MQGCEHYKRKVKIVAPCCKQTFDCRFCHDEKEDHQMDRKSVKEVVCRLCGEWQTVGRFCQHCGTRFATYICLTCNLFDDEEKGQFHCKDCGLCRIGGSHNFFHCSKCNYCLNINLLGNHKCVENALKNNCTVCLEDMHTSRSTVHVPKCGHPLHEKCFKQLETAGHHNCPSCQSQMKA